MATYQSIKNKQTNKTTTTTKSSELNLHYLNQLKINDFKIRYYRSIDNFPQFSFVPVSHGALTVKKKKGSESGFVYNSLVSIHDM